VISVLGGFAASRSSALHPAVGLFVRTQEGSLFPLFPWIAHFLLGAIVARLHLDLAWLASTRRLALVVAAAGAALLLVGWAWQGLSPVNTDDLAVWVSDPAVFLSRAGMAWCAFAVFALALGELPSRPWLKEVASHALSIYVVHLVALYGWPGTDGLVQRVGPTLGALGTYLAGPTLFIACALVVVAISSAIAQGKRLGHTAIERAIHGGEPT